MDYRIAPRKWGVTCHSRIRRVFARNSRCSSGERAGQSSSQAGVPNNGRRFEPAARLALGDRRAPAVPRGRVTAGLSAWSLLCAKVFCSIPRPRRDEMAAIVIRCRAPLSLLAGVVAPRPPPRLRGSPPHARTLTPYFPVQGPPHLAARQDIVLSPGRSIGPRRCPCVTPTGGSSCHETSAASPWQGSFLR